MSSAQPVQQKCSWSDTLLRLDMLINAPVQYLCEHQAPPLKKTQKLELTLLYIIEHEQISICLMPVMVCTRSAQVFAHVLEAGVL